ncbi:NACHT, LRR and PYD domains-containing protein 3-like [Trichomycterus rosablanca]|uniref:NACHT, LRR and PYD domains-containing protein 3-like n=1 Tax=Trichomycterus rosablanca TaxID=2290929 RepID=UPI002F34FC33
MFMHIIPSYNRSDSASAGTELQKNFKLHLLQKFQCLNDIISNQENPTLLNEIYTELYITEEDTGDVNNEHEVRQIEEASRRSTTEETPINCNDIFKPLSEEDKPIRTVLTKGVAGIGKTVSVQKFILDWAEGKANQDLHFIFPLPFRELNLMKDQKLMDLLSFSFKDMKETEMSSLQKVLFIFDGLDECRFSLDFLNTDRLCDVTESASVNVLLVNLIKGNLLPSALIWITSRPGAADQIPSECVDRVTEVRGFSNPRKEEYFMKRISDQSLANRVITHLKSLRSLYIMCHIPVFCWISATVLERLLDEAEDAKIPKTLTQMYTHYLIIQTNIKREKYSKNQDTDEEMILKLGKLAFNQLMKGNLIFYEEDLIECGINVREALVYSGVCTQIFREEFGLNQIKVFCFVHLSIQEHLAALHVHLMFIKQKKNVLQNSWFYKLWLLFRQETIADVHRTAVDEALKSKNGHLDLFLRFLLGLSLESNQTLLDPLVTHTGSSSHSKEETVQFIKKKISLNTSAEKSINMFHCLNELGDHSLVEEVQRYLQSGNLQERELSTSQWSALVFVLLTSEQKQDETDSTSDQVLQHLLPVVAESKNAELNNCGVSGEGCAALASALSSNSSHLRHLDLSMNELGESGMKRLSAVLENPDCKLEKLGGNFQLKKCCGRHRTVCQASSQCIPSIRLGDCDVSDEGCAALASALTSNPSHLRDLNMSNNNLGNSGVKLLSAALENPHCELEKLGLNQCGLADEGCVALASALTSNFSLVTDLNLTQNKLGDSGVKLLSVGLENPHCKLEILGLRFCGVTDKGCSALASALRSNPSHLRDLNITRNKLGDSGVKLLSAGLENPHCKLEKLG